MEKTIRKIAGVLIALISFAFLVWCLLSFQYDFTTRMVFNIIGFFGVAGGLYLVGIDLFRLGKPKEPYEREDAPKPEKKKEPEKVELKNFEKEDHDKYMPK